MCNFYAVYLRHPGNKDAYIKFLKENALNDGVYYIINPVYNEFPDVFKRNMFGLRYPNFLGILYYPGDAVSFPSRYGYGVILDHIYTQEMEADVYFKNKLPKLFEKKVFDPSLVDPYKWLPDYLRLYARIVDHPGDYDSYQLRVATREMDTFWAQQHKKDALLKLAKYQDHVKDVLSNPDRIYMYNTYRDIYVEWIYMMDQKGYYLSYPREVPMFFDYWWILVSNNALPKVYKWEMTAYINWMERKEDPEFERKRQFLLKKCFFEKWEGPREIEFNVQNFPWLEWMVYHKY